MLVGSVAIGLCSSGGFCAGSQTVVDHQVSRFLTIIGLSSHTLHPAYQRTLIRLLSLHACTPLRQRFGRNQHPSVNSLNPDSPPRKHPCRALHPRSRRLYHPPVAPRLSHHPHLHPTSPDHFSAPLQRRGAEPFETLKSDFCATTGRGHVGLGC